MRPSLLHPEVSLPDEPAVDLPLEHVLHIDEHEKPTVAWRTRIRSVAVKLMLLAVTFGCMLVIALIAEIGLGYHGQLQSDIHGSTPRPAVRDQSTFGLPGYTRPESYTYLGYTEWYPVLSYDELARFQESEPANDFPYLRAVLGYWSSYRAMGRATAGKYAFDWRQNAALAVGGLNFAAAYTLKGAYEESFGRLSAWTSHGRLTEEDEYDARVTREYADFLRLHPFYEFNFAHHVAGLWSSTHLYGENLIRKTEREVFLTTEYSVAALYCWIVEKFAHTGRRFQAPNTYAWIAVPPDFAWSNFSAVKAVKPLGPREYIVSLPHSQEFTTITEKLVDANVRFVEIAGNGNILLSVLVPAGTRPVLDAATQLNRAPLLSDPAQERLLINCPTDNLTVVVFALHSQGLPIEHIYDY